MTTITAPICSGCRHYRPESPLIACDAYPGGIPDAIVRSEADHRKPYAGDHGIRFEPESSADSKYADTVFPAPLTSYAVNVDAEVWAYSPGQKRDSVGRFGSGGGGPSGSSGGGAGTAGETYEGQDNSARLRTDFQRQKEDTADDGNAYGAVSRKLKARAMKEMGADLDAQFDEDRLAKAIDGMTEAVGGHGSTYGENMADAVLSTWQQHAYFQGAPDSIALQVAVGREFKTGVGAHIKKDFGGEPSFTGADTEKGIDRWPEENGYDMPVLQAAVRSMYKHTQQHLDDIGMKGDITLYRGVHNGSHRGDVPSDFNAASSWSTDRYTADDFATRSGSRLSMTVPRERVLAIPGHGVGCYEEEEVVLLRADGDQVHATDPT